MTRIFNIVSVLFVFCAFSASAAENPWQQRYADAAAATSSAQPATYLHDSSHEVTYGDIKQVLAQELTAQGAGENLRVNIPRPDSQVVLSQDAPIEMQLSEVTFDAGFKTFTATAHFSSAGKPLAPMKLSGSFDEMVEVVLLKRRLTQKEVIDANDIVMQTVPIRRLHGEAITDASEIIGKSPRRTISALRPIRQDEIIMPPIVAKGDKITLFYRQGSMEIKTLAEVLESGAAGETIRVRNVDSHLVLQARLENESSAEVLHDNALSVATRQARGRGNT
jgi:flagella basal body P-ring formation protein FlgA